MKESIYYGHSDSKGGLWQALRSHLEGVMDRTVGALRGWYGEDEARLAALLHDLGKYTEAFQRRLRGEEKGLDHWSAGAFACLRNHECAAAALAVFGHHVGLPALADLKNKKTLEAFGGPLRLSSGNLDEQLEAFRQDGLQVLSPKQRICNPERCAKIGSIGWQLDVRRLFSALVDADFLDTEEHFQDGARSAGTPIQAKDDFERLLAFRAEIRKASEATADVNRVRDEVFAACIRAAELGVGIYTLAAPTGAGKTLAMLAFAQQHCVTHGLRRVITVLPFLTLIEQTAQIYRRIITGAEDLLEHHSLSDLKQAATDQDADGQSADSSRIRQLTENWDAPYIVTTNVQFFESLFAARPGKCRKLHRIANSVILLDEVQTLPRALAIPTLAALSHLSRYWGCTVLLATATQPAFESLSKEVAALHPAGWPTTPIIVDTTTHFLTLRRTRYDFRSPEQTVTLSDLAEEVAREKSALVVVNLKRHAKTLWELLKPLQPDSYHLSTQMCPEHRRAVLDKVRQRLRRGLPTFLVSTQCIEAGVDLDFPRLYRAYGPWDSMVQAAGRCNREGKLEYGLCTLFAPEDERFPDRIYGQATEVAKTLLRRNPEANLDDPTLIKRYFESLYDVSNLHNKELEGFIRAARFPDVAQRYRLISEDTINLVVPYPDSFKVYEKLRNRAQYVNRAWFREARALAVAVFRPKEKDPIWQYLGSVQRGGTDHQVADWWVYLRPEHYHPDLGLVPPKDFEDLIF